MKRLWIQAICGLVAAFDAYTLWFACQADVMGGASRRLWRYTIKMKVRELVLRADLRMGAHKLKPALSEPERILLQALIERLRSLV